MINLHSARQTFDFDCGAKALQMVMAYYGVDIREDQLIKLLGSGKDEGTPVSQMVAVAEKCGFKVNAGYGWALKEVKKLVNFGHPVIVLLQAWADRYMKIDDWRKDYDDGHYAIVIGCAKGVLLFEDPESIRKTWLRESEFLARWHDRDPKTGKTCEHFGMALLGKSPASNGVRHMD